MVTDTEKELVEGFTYVDDVLHHTLDDVTDLPARCAFLYLEHGRCDGEIHRGEGYVALMPLGVVHMEHVGSIHMEMPE